MGSEFNKILAYQSNIIKPVIAIGGLSGTGKTTLGINLQKRLKQKGFNLPFYESGYFFRKIAKEKGYLEKDLEKFSAVFVEGLDEMIDVQCVKQMVETGGIFVGRLVHVLCGNKGFRIFLKVDPEVAARRISLDENRPEKGSGISELMQKIKSRDQEDVNRYAKLYGIDYKQTINECDLVIDTSKLDKKSVLKISEIGCLNYLKSLV
ncbi:MAG: cytidylate kinase family protein [archaeon]